MNHRPNRLGAVIAAVVLGVLGITAGIANAVSGPQPGPTTKSAKTPPATAAPLYPAATPQPKVWSTPLIVRHHAHPNVIPAPIGAATAPLPQKTSGPLITETPRTPLRVILETQRPGGAP